MLRLLRRLVPLAIAALPAAQTRTVIAPAGFGYDQRAGEGRVDSPFGGSQVRELQLFDNNALGFGATTVIGVAFRRDPGPGTYAGFSSTIQLSLAYSGQRPERMPHRFASVIAGGSQSVFSGNLAIPVASSSGSGPQPFALRIPFSRPFVFNPGLGNLVLDLRTRQSALTPWRRDARQLQTGTPGSLRRLVNACRNQNGFPMTQNLTDPRHAAPGRRLQIRLAGSPPFDTDVDHILGVPAATPFDLTPFGAPGCTLGVWPWFAITRVPTSSATLSFSYAFAEYLVPDDPRLVGATIGSQWVNADRPAGNTLGVVLSDAVAITLGRAGGRYATQTISARGLAQDVGQMFDGERGAIVRFEIR